MVTCQSVNQLKTPAKGFLSLQKVSQFGSLGDTIMGKTADTTVVQKTSLTPFTRRVSHKNSLPKKLTVHRVLYPSLLTESWVEGKGVKEKDVQPTERTAALWGLSSKIDSRICMNFTRNELRLGSRHQEPPHRCVKEFGYSCRQRRLTWAKEKKELDCCPVVQSPLFRWEQVLDFIWKPRVLESGGRVEKLIAQVCLKSSVKFPQSNDLGCNVICWCWVHCVFWKPTSQYPFTKKLLLTSFLKMLISFSSRIW